MVRGCVRVLTSRVRVRHARDDRDGRWARRTHSLPRSRPPRPSVATPYTELLLNATLPPSLTPSHGDIFRPRPRPRPQPRHLDFSTSRTPPLLHSLAPREPQESYVSLPHPTLLRPRHTQPHTHTNASIVVHLGPQPRRLAPEPNRTCPPLPTPSHGERNDSRWQPQTHTLPPRSTEGGKEIVVDG